MLEFRAIFLLLRLPDYYRAMGTDIYSKFGLKSIKQAQLHKGVSCSKMKFLIKLKLSDILIKANETDS